MDIVEITDEILAVVQRYVDRETTRARAAKELGVSERHFTRMVEELNLERKQSKRAQEEEAAAKRALAKKEAAIAVIRGQATLVQAGARAGCHPRTIKRLVEKLRAEKPKRLTKT